MKTMRYKSLVFLLTSALSVCSCESRVGALGGESYKKYGEQVEDKKLIANVRQNFRNNKAIPDHLVHLSIDRGIVQLSGFVHNAQEADLVFLTTTSTPGVKDVIDNLVVLSGSEYARRRAAAESRDTKR